MKKRPHNFRTKYRDSRHSGKNERKLYFESRIELLSTKSTLENCSSKGCTQGDLSQNFSTFPNTIRNLDFYVKTHPDLDGKEHTIKILIELEDTFTFCNHGPKNYHFMVCTEKAILIKYEYFA